MNTIKTFTFVSALVTFLAMTGTVHARTPVGNEIFGIGLQLGDPSAVTAKLLPTPVFGFQAYIGGGGWNSRYSWGRMFITGIDVVFHPVTFHEWRTCALNLTLGGGAALGVFRGWWNANWNDPYPYDNYYYADQWYASMFLRFVTGANLWFKKIPLECFVELTPALRLFRPDPVGFHMFWVAAGARWWF